VISGSSQLSVRNSKALFNAETLRHDFIGKQILQAGVAEVDEDQLATQVFDCADEGAPARQDHSGLL